MTVVLCLNYGDRIYMASDSLVTKKVKDRLIPSGYRLKIYTLPNCNAIVGFAGALNTAAPVLRAIAKHAVPEDKPEGTLFKRLPQIVRATIDQLEPDCQNDLDVIFAGITPNSKAYEQEKFPGLGVPPCSYCGVLSWRKNEPNSLKARRGHAIHVPSKKGMWFTAPDPTLLMDIFVVGSGAKTIVPEPRYYHYYYGFRDNPPQFMMKIMGHALAEFFSHIPTKLSGVGGEYQVAHVTEEGITMCISTADDPFKRVKVELKHGAYVVADLETGTSDVIQTIWDRRYPYEIREMGYLL